MPGVPQDVGAVLIEHAAEKCVVTSLWRSPNNTNEANVTRYVVSVNETTSYNITVNINENSNNSISVNINNNTISVNINNNMISALLPVSTCAAYQITMRAVNVCGQSPNTPNFMLDPKSRHTIPTFTCGAINNKCKLKDIMHMYSCLLYTSPSPRDATLSRMPSSA